MTFGLGLRWLRNTLLMPSFSSGCWFRDKFLAVPQIGSAVLVRPSAVVIQKESVPEPACGTTGSIAVSAVPGFALEPSSAPQVFALWPFAFRTEQLKISFSWARVRLFGALEFLVVA